MVDHFWRAFKWQNTRQLHEGGDDLVAHVEVGGDVGEEEDGPGRLGDDEEVDHGVEDPGPGKQSEAEERRAVGGVGEDVEKSQDSEGHNILDVVLMSSPHPLNILICPALQSLVKLLSVSGSPNEPGCPAAWRPQKRWMSLSWTSA